MFRFTNFQSLLLFIILLFFGNMTFAQPLPDQAMVDKANDQGSIRVIVQLDVGFIPEGNMPDAATVGLQRAAIASAQGRVIRNLKSKQASVVARYQTIPGLALKVDAEELQQLYTLSDVVRVVEDIPLPLAMAESNVIIGSDVAWNAGYTGAGQTVVILDTGVDKSHPFFSTTSGNKIVSEACFSSNEAGYSSSVCPGGVEVSTSTDSGIDCTDAASGYYDAQGDCAHGTHVAGTAAGGIGPDFGVAPDADIISIQIFSLFPTYCDGSDCMLTWQSDQIAALEHVYNNLQHSFNISSINMSIGGGTYYDPCDSAPQKNIIDNLRSDGIVTVIASGNSGYTNAMGSPACISSAVSVGATKDDDDVASFSNVASFLDLFAPGYTITSSVPGGGTATWAGTSMATPHVAGAWAVLKQANPTATVDDILQALKSTGTPINDQRSDGSVTGTPRINVDLALDSLVITEPDTTVPNITAPADVIQEATGETTVVNLGTPTVSDDIDPSPTVFNDSPATFSVGVTTVTWTAVDAAGNSATASQTVTVTDTTGPVITLLGGNPVDIPVGTSYTDAGATASDLVDGDLTAAITTNSTVDTSTVGTYSVSYDVSDSRGNNAATVSRTVTVSEATAALSVTSLSPSVVQLGVQSFIVINGTGFDASTSVSFANGIGPAPSYTINSYSSTRLEGVLLAEGGPSKDRVWDVNVTNADGSSDTLSGGLVVTIGAPDTNQAPVADAGSDQEVTDTDGSGFESVSLDGSASYDPDGSDLTYSWTWPGGVGASSATPTASFPVGTTTVTLTVSDGELSASNTVSITVNASLTNQAPVADAGSEQVVADTDDSGFESVSLDGSASYDPDGSDLTYSWTWSGGVGASGATLTASFPVGTTIVTLTVSDGELSSTDTVTVTVTSPSSGITITSVTEYKVKGRQKVDLEWSGGATEMVDVLRNGLKVLTTGNDGAETDNIDQVGGGSYVYKICESEDNSACSDEVTVTF